MATYYEEKKRKFRLSWKDAVLEQKGVEKPYSRMTIGWKQKKNPTKAQLKELLKQYDAICEEKKKECELLAEHIIKSQKGDENGIRKVTVTWSEHGKVRRKYFDYSLEGVEQAKDINATKKQELKRFGQEFGTISDDEKQALDFMESLCQGSDG